MIFPATSSVSLILNCLRIQPVLKLYGRVRIPNISVLTLRSQKRGGLTIKIHFQQDLISALVMLTEIQNRFLLKNCFMQEEQIASEGGRREQSARDQRKLTQHSPFQTKPAILSWR